MRVVWTDTARDHLRGIHEYIALDSPRYALATVDRITRCAEQAVQFPLSGGHVPEHDSDDVREFLDHPYRIIYRVKQDRVEVIAVVHGARTLPQTFD